MSAFGKHNRGLSILGWHDGGAPEFSVTWTNIICILSCCFLSMVAARVGRGREGSKGGRKDRQLFFNS